jgi:hypothetical protein
MTKLPSLRELRAWVDQQEEDLVTTHVNEGKPYVHLSGRDYPEPSIILWIEDFDLEKSLGTIEELLLSPLENYTNYTTELIDPAEPDVLKLKAILVKVIAEIDRLMTPAAEPADA